MFKLIITAAITGGEPVSREMTPYVPTTVEEITDEAVKYWEAGASIVHLHAKEPGTGKPHPDPNPALRDYVEQIQSKTNLICNVTTGGGRRVSDKARARPDSLSSKEATTASMPTIVFNVVTVLHRFLRRNSKIKSSLPRSNS